MYLYNIFAILSCSARMRPKKPVPKIGCFEVTFYNKRSRTWHERLVSRSFFSENKPIIFREVGNSSELQPYAFWGRRERKESMVVTFCKLISFNNAQSIACARGPAADIWTRFQLPTLSALVHCLYLDCASLYDECAYDTRDGPGIFGLLDMLSVWAV
jgi:hypothetical protein